MSTADALRQSAFEVLEEGMFVFLDPAVPSDPAPALRYRMAIEGSHCAEIGLAMSEGFARQVAGGMMGMDPDEVEDADLRLSAAEALNIVAGKVAAMVAGFGAELELRPPVAGGEPLGDVVAFDAEGGHLQLWYAA
jgi:chemotaxis protein CheY-P-specific phosphatase CheC